MIREGDDRHFHYHIFTPEERVSKLHECEDLKWVADECSKVLGNPETEERKRSMASNMIPDCNVEIAKGIKAIKEIKERYSNPAHFIEDYGYGS